jgi:hypothetical protein
VPEAFRDLLAPELFARPERTFQTVQGLAFYRMPHQAPHLHAALSASGVARLEPDSTTTKIGPSANTAPNFEVLAEIRQ